MFSSHKKDKRMYPYRIRATAHLSRVILAWSVFACSEANPQIQAVCGTVNPGLLPFHHSLGKCCKHGMPRARLQNFQVLLTVRYGMHRFLLESFSSPSRGISRKCLLGLEIDSMFFHFSLIFWSKFSSEKSSYSTTVLETSQDDRR